MTQNEMTGVVFEIKEMAVFDGPGIRTTVFLKGCPLRCVWCHNPEGLSPSRQIMAASGGCAHCGRCEAACPQGLDRASCTLCGACVTACPNRLRRICGTEYTSGDLARLLLKNWDYLAKQGGGVTFSGGEPTMQAGFLLDTLRKLDGMHRAVETCGYCAPREFARVLSHVELVLFDLKLIDPEKHRQYTGADNALILANLETLRHSGLPFVVRIPLIPGVNDGAENMRASAELLRSIPSLQTVELLPYHRTAGAKYPMVGREYDPPFDADQSVRVMAEIFAEYGVPCRAL